MLNLVVPGPVGKIDQSTLSYPTEYISRVANRLCQQLYPDEPNDVNFKLQQNHIPDDFFQANLESSNTCHILFTTREQLKYLSKAKTWYVDGTFKLICHPFSQLLTVNAFVRSGDQTKKVLLLFLLMAEKRRRDYKDVTCV